MSPPTPLAREVGIAILLSLVLTALYPAVVFGGHVFFERDLHQMLFAQYATFARTIRSGSWPVWDSWLGFGQPMLANPAAQVLYPPTWLCLVLEPGRAYTVYVYVHLVGGALAVRALARRLGVSPLGGLVSALCFMLSGPMLSLVNLWHHLAGASLMPLVWLAAIDVRRQPGLRPAILWGGAMGLQVLAGSFDMCVLTLLMTGAFCLLPDAAGRPPMRTLLVPLAAAASVTLALAAGLLIPLLEVWRGSARVALGESMRAFWSLHPALLLQVALPLYPQALTLPAPTRALLFEGREPFLASVYLGITTLPIVAAALLPRPRRPALFLALAFSGAALVALGRHGLAYPTLVEWFPPLGSLRYPSKVTVVMALAWALLAGVGIDAVREAGRERRLLRPTLALGALVVLAAGTLAVVMLLAPPSWLVSPVLLAGTATAARTTSTAGLRLFAAAGLGLTTLAVLFRGSPSSGTRLLCLAGLDLALAHHGLNETAPAGLFATPPAVVSHLPSEGFVRIHAWDYLTRVVGKSYRRSEPTIPSPEARRDLPAAVATALARHDFLSPPTAARFGLHGSFDRDWLGLQPRGQRNLGLFFQAQEETPGARRMLRLAGVSYAVSLHREGLEDLEHVATAPSDFAGAVHLSRVTDPLPLAYAVSGHRIADGLPALRLLVDPDFDPAREVVLAEGREASPVAGFAARSHLADFRPDFVRVETELSAAGFLVTLASFDSGWRARVDGKDVKVERANVGFLGVPVPAGQHVVELRYWPAGLSLGLGLTAAAALLTTAGLLRRS